MSIFRNNVVTKFDKHGFTLVELLVTIAIISLLSSIVLTSLNSARAKARDARKQADFRQISTALSFFFDEFERMPANNNCCGSFCAGAGGCGACEDSASQAYNASMQELVDAGFLASIPKSPGGSEYCYYDYGAGGEIGGILVTDLEAVPDTTTGIPPSCRPWSAGTNWCDLDSDKAYCICNPY